MRLRNVIILSICQALGFAGTPLVLLVGGIVGTDLAPSPAWATLPTSAMVVGTALFTVPGALTMGRIGRRMGFVISAVMALLASLASVYAISSHSFLVFCLSMLFIGGNLAFVQQYRFAAAESVDQHQVGKAVSFVLLGGVVAGYLGTQIGRLAKDWLTLGAYSGSFLAMAVLYGVVAILLLALKEGGVDEQAVAGPERPLRAIMIQPVYLIALWSAVVAYAVMGFIMTAAPISMHIMDHFGLGDTAFVIQSHIAAMYLPSLFTGFIISHIGAVRLILMGLVSMIVCTIVAPLGHGLLNYLTSLVLLGIGWNFGFVGATVLLTRSYSPSERFKAQAANDLSVFSIMALATLSAGLVIFRANWSFLNLLTMPFLAFTFVLILLTRGMIAAQRSFT